MKNTDINTYFSNLDSELSTLDNKSRDKFIAEEFPKYKHIGRYIDPSNIEERDYYNDILESDLKDFSFDPLIAFEMDQIKYSTEILHPLCTCFRRSKIKKRPIKISSHRDRILYASWNQYLSQKHKIWLKNNNISDSVAAYVPETGKFNADYAKQAFDYIQDRDEYYAVALDVKSFFDKIPHKHLKENLITLLDDSTMLSNVNHRLYKAVTKYTFIQLDQLSQKLPQLEGGPGMHFGRSHKNWSKLRDLHLIENNRNEGIPQGLPCSGVLANISMMQFDLKIQQAAVESDSIYLRYADDIFIAAPNKTIIQILQGLCENELDILQLPLAPKKTEKFNFKKGSINHPKVSYLGLECKGNEVSVRMNSVNKFYQKTSKFIYSYVLTCRKRGIKPSRRKIRAVFSHSGRRNYYSYLRRASEVFESDPTYKAKGIKGVLKNHLKWIDKIFDNALISKLSKTGQRFKNDSFCNCPLKLDK